MDQGVILDIEDGVLGVCSKLRLCGIAD